MTHRLQHLESVSCSCGHGYCVFCIKAYLERQKLRSSFPQADAEWLMSTQLEPGDSRDAAEKPPTSDGEFNMAAPQRSRPTSRRKASGGEVLPPRVSRPIEDAEVKPLAPDFSTRAEFLRHAQEVTLDPHTAFRKLALSEGNRRVTNIGRSQGHLDGPDRFSFFWQVLGAQGLEGRSYLEVEWSGPWVYAAVAYQSIQRYGNGRECGFGGNAESWALHCRRGGYNFWHDGESTAVSGPVEQKVGLYLDHDAGVLTFYSVRDETMTALHRVHATFAQTLHFGLWLAVGASAVFCKLK